MPQTGHSLVEDGRLVGFLAVAGGGGLGAGRFLLRLVEVFVGALLAQVQFFELIFAEDFGDVQGGGLVDTSGTSSPQFPAVSQAR